MTKFITNQNIEINLEIASLGDRIIAFIIDSFIIGCYFFFVIIILRNLNVEESFFFISLIPALCYSLAFEVFMNGQSPGKRIRDIKVVKLDGGSASIGNYLLRWLLRPIDITIYGAVAVICIILTKNGQRLGDLTAGTTVIKVKERSELADIKTIPKSEDYIIVFPQVKRLSDKQVEIIRRSLNVGSDGFNHSAINELTDKVKEVLQVESDLTNVKFLYTLVSDYEHL